MLRLLSDENFHGDIVRGLLLRLPTLALVRVQDVGLEGAEDPDVLAWAAEHNRIHPVVRQNFSAIGSTKSSLVPMRISSSCPVNRPILAVQSEPRTVKVSDVCSRMSG